MLSTGRGVLARTTASTGLGEVRRLVLARCWIEFRSTCLGKLCGNGGELRIILNDDGTVTHIIHGGTGTFAFYNTDGKVVDRAPGSFTFELVFDDAVRLPTSQTTSS